VVAPQHVTRVSLQSLQAPVQAELEGVFAELGRIARADFPLIGDVNRHLLAIRGKLFRPTLTLLSARASDNLSPHTLRLAAVVELIHLATLIHDDSVDHSVLRRGQPTVNAQFSHQIAVIMGDYLYSRAIVELVELNDLEPLRVMSRVTTEMTVGEMREIEAHDLLDYTLADYERMIDAKTASLMAGACEVGAIGGDPYTSTQDVMGKPAGLDLHEHKITLPLIAALPVMEPAERERVARLMADPEPAREDVAEIVGIVERRGGIAAAAVRAQEFALAAERELAVLPDSRARDALRDCVAYVVQRRR
jgi:octaprenyl-diphosphate synthase